MPAYNAELTLEKTYKDLPKHIVDRVILVDDGSSDRTVEIAGRLGLKTIVHMKNCGYGANQKTCYMEALADGADIIVMLHPDYQYDSRLVPEMISPIIEGHADFVLGSRMLGHGALKGGMPLYKYISNKMLTMFENFIMGKHYSELHTGFRAYSRKCLLALPFMLNSDDFVFDTQVIAQVEAKGFHTSEVPVPTRYFKEASSINFLRSSVYGLATLGVMGRFFLHRAGIKKDAVFSKQLADVLSPEQAARIKELKPSGRRIKKKAAKK
ncbi:MAG TPA: glycosyltransferase family 2 protein [bacterium]|nr:glycosyltransferase family 2 protein [bacterium]